MRGVVNILKQQVSPYVVQWLHHVCRYEVWSHNHPLPLLLYLKARQLILDHGLNLSTLEEVPEVSAGSNSTGIVIWIW